MEIIGTHDMADFDALASAVLAQRLYPGAQIVLGRLLHPEVRDFLALHKDRFPHLRWSDLDAQAVTRLVLVDVRRRGRVRDFEAVLERAERGEVDVQVWDHHAAARDDVPAAFARQEPVGAAVTLLVEELRRRGLALDPIEATLCALGIHTDTGSLTYATTSARDADALAFLLRRGVSQGVVDRYVHRAYGEGQRRVLAELMRGAEVRRIGGVDVAFATVRLGRAVDGVGEVTTQVLELEGHQAFFALYVIGRRKIQVVGRSRSGLLDVGAVLEAIGGGGHRSAGSAIVKGSDLEGLRARLEAALEAHAPRAQRVEELMSSPVHTVEADTPLSDLAVALDAFSHTGVPVVRDGAIVGLISRRDLDEARRDGRTHLPVSSCMSHGVHTVEQGATLEEALERMTQEDVGRLPVLSDGRLVGILTRSDLRRVLYRDVSPDLSA